MVVERKTEIEERNQLAKEYHKVTQKHEEEVNLRIQFESKINTLHQENRHLQTQLKNTKVRLGEEQSRAKGLEEELSEVKSRFDEKVMQLEELEEDYK